LGQTHLVEKSDRLGFAGPSDLLRGPQSLSLSHIDQDSAAEYVSNVAFIGSQKIECHYFLSLSLLLDKEFAK
jgi:hypothetical protein